MASSVSSTNLIDRIARDDPELQHLYLSSDSTSSNAQELAAALVNSQNTRIRRVCFRNFKVGDDDLPLLLQASVQLCNLQSLSFHCTELRASLLASVLKNNNKISTLGLRYCQLKCDNELERQEFHATLQANASLQEVSVECCEWQQTELQQPTYFLLDSICGIKTLRHLEWCAHLAPPQEEPQSKRLPVNTLDRICRIGRLQTLRLRNLWLPQEDVARLCAGLTVSPRLQKLVLSLDLGNTSARALAQLLNNNKSTSSLKHLALRIDRLVDPDSPQWLALALAQQQQGCLQHFHLSGQEARQISPEAKRAFTNTMQTNTCLEFVRLDVSDYALQSEVAFYLDLNHKGRRELFERLQRQPANHSQRRLWVRALCQNATDLRALHYFLSLHPAVFATAALEAEAKSVVVSQHKKQRCYKWNDADEGIVYDSDGW